MTRCMMNDTQIINHTLVTTRCCRCGAHIWVLNKDKTRSHIVDGFPMCCLKVNSIDWRVERFGSGWRGSIHSTLTSEGGVWHAEDCWWHTGNLVTCAVHSRWLSASSPNSRQTMTPAARRCVKCYQLISIQTLFVKQCGNYYLDAWLFICTRCVPEECKNNDFH